MPREIKNFDLTDKETNTISTRRKVVEFEPSHFYDEEVPNMQGHSSIPEGVELKKQIKGGENNVKLNKFEKKLQEIGIIPSDDWISGPSKNLWVNLAKNFFTESLGIKPEEEFADNEWIIELPQLDGVDELKPSYDIQAPEPVQEVKEEKTEIKEEPKRQMSEMELLFYSDDTDELDIAPSCCEVFK